VFEVGECQWRVEDCVGIQMIDWKRNGEEQDVHGRIAWNGVYEFWTASPIEALPDWIGIGIRFIAIIYVTCLVSC
jgi:hypothetical protein